MGNLYDTVNEYHRLFSKAVPDEGNPDSVPFRRVINQAVDNEVLREKSNPVYQRIVQGEDLTDILEFAERKNKGWKKYIPWKKDRGHNFTLKNIGHLMDYPSHLEANGWKKMDNFSGAFLVFGGISYGVLSLARYFSPDPEMMSWLPEIVGFYAGLYAGISQGRDRWKEKIDYSQARFVTKVIRTVHNKQDHSKPYKSKDDGDETII